MREVSAFNFFRRLATPPLALLAPIVSVPADAPVPPHFDFYFRAPSTSFAQTRTVDLDSDGRAEIIEVDTRRARTLRISHAGKQGRAQVLWQGVQARVRPWCLRVGDVDGDGKKEVALGTFKGTRLWPRPHRTLSFYAWDPKSKTARARWLGSRLTLPFREFYLANVDSDRADELLAVERGKDARWSLAVYNWDAFGFTLARRVGSWNIVRVTSVTSRRLTLEGDKKIVHIEAKIRRTNS
jgi:hypothetical protein